jgi:hypothetical protein
MTPPQPIGAMSSSRVFLGELLSSRARLRFPGQPHAQTINSRSSRKYQRTAYRDFLLCLTPGVHSNPCFRVKTLEAPNST